MDDNTNHIIPHKIKQMEQVVIKAINQTKIKDPLLTGIEVQDYLKKSAKWVDIHKHDIGCSKVGGEWRFRLSDIEEYANQSYHKNN